MRKNSEFAFLEIPSRQSIVAIILILLKLVRTLARQFWPILLIILFNPNKSSDTFWLKLVGGLGIFAAVRSIISYFKFYFYVKDEELVIEKGILQKSKLNIPIDRIQTVNFRQNILHQAFNVVAVEIDTAGSMGNEFSIQALDKDRAEALRRYVESQKAEITTEVDETVVTQEPQQELLLKLQPSDLLKIGISQNHLRTAGIIMAFFWGFLDDIEGAFNLKIFDNLEKWMMEEGNSWFIILLVGIPFFLIVSFLITLINSVLRDFDFKFWKTATGFKVQSGLFTKKENSANLRKIQLIRWSSTPLKRLFGLLTVRLSQAASFAVGRKHSINIPGCYQPHLQKVRQIWFPGESPEDYESHRISKLITWRKVLYQGIVPTGFLILIFWGNFGKGALLWLFLIPIVYIWSLRYYATWIYSITDEGLHTRSGVITHRETLLQWYKIQAVRIRQSIYQRRKNVADILFFTAAGAVKIPYVELEKAEMLRDYVLYKAETDKRDWM